MRHLLALLTVVAALGLTTSSAQAAGTEWSVMWGNSQNGQVAAYYNGATGTSMVVIGNEIMQFESEAELLAFVAAMNALQSWAVTAGGTQVVGYEAIGRAAAGIVRGDPALAYGQAPAGVADLFDLAVAQVWGDLHGDPVHGQVVGPVKRAQVDGSQIPNGTTYDVSKVLDGVWTVTTPAFPFLDELKLPPATATPGTPPVPGSEPLEPLRTLDGTEYIPVELDTGRILDLLSAGAMLGGIGAGAAGPVGGFYPLGGLRLAQDLARPRFDWHAPAAGAPADEPPAAQDEPACGADQICPGDPDYPTDPAPGPDDEDAPSCIGRECQAGGGAGGIIQIGETGCGLVRCQVDPQLPGPGRLTPVRP
jgi:hypothetical protein